VEGDSGEAGGRCESVETLSDRVGMWRAAALTGEDVIATGDRTACAAKITPPQCILGAANPSPSEAAARLIHRMKQPELIACRMVTR
jgi:hypothetical protein